MSNDDKVGVRPALEEALREVDRLRAENRELKQTLESFQQPTAGLPDTEAVLGTELEEERSHEEPSATLTSGQKVGLFRRLFRGREDVFATRWENRKGRSGYSPACANEWKSGVCEKPRIKCSNCLYRDSLPVTDQVIRDHLTGKQTIGVYALLQDETCWFVAADFDKDQWLEDATLYQRICKEHGVDAIVERSRSGKGGHVWIFFDAPISARLARRLGSFFLTKAMERRHQVGLDSYDRLFPNQDTMPKGGFGNLIALPLQNDPRRKWNSVFIRENGEAYADQWIVLLKVRRTLQRDVEKLLTSVGCYEEIGVIPFLPDEEEALDRPWQRSDGKPKPIGGPLPDEVKITIADRIYIEKADLPSPMINRILRLAAFQNPEFYRAQAMRLSTYGKPRVIFCGEDFPKHVGLPRGCFLLLSELFEEHEIALNLQDERNSGKRIKGCFRGRLRPNQRRATAELVKHDIGVLSATTAFGKTVVGAWIIAKRKVNTLVLVHRRQLMDQWKERLSMFLNVPEGSIGEIGAGKSRISGIIDVGMIQSLHRKGTVKALVENYGQVIVDECHHIPAFSFERVLTHAKSKYVLGLTATPIRKDGHHPIITMQCGPIRFKVSEKERQRSSKAEHVVLPRFTNFRTNKTDLRIQELYAALTENEERNNLVFDDVLKNLDAKRSPLILTERTEHLDIMERRLRKVARNVFVFRGGMGRKQRNALMSEMSALADDQERVILATGRYLGEGFDDDRLDTLFLLLPISWKGTLQQYVGRLHRAHIGKRLVEVYDYVDYEVPMLKKMYQRRLRGYKALGYSVKEDPRFESFGESVRYVPDDGASISGEGLQAYSGRETEMSLDNL